MLELERILNEREARGLRIPAGLRVAVSLYLAISLTLWAPAPFASRVFALPAALVLAAINLGFLWLLGQRRHVRAVGYAGALFDGLMIAAAALSWYWGGGRGELAPGFLLKAPLTIFSLALIAINSLALRAVYPLIVTAGAVLVHGSVAYAIVVDPRTRWAEDFADLFAGPSVTPILIANQIVITIVVGGGLAYLSHTAQRTIRQTVELELERARTRQEQARLLMEQKLDALAKLVAGVSHEVNSPLGALTASADTQLRALVQLETALAAADPEGWRRPLAALRSSAELGRSAAARIDQTMDSLRRFARLDEASRKRVELGSCLQSALSMLPAELRPRAPELTPGEPMAVAVECDPGQLTQALFALLQHACERSVDQIALDAHREADGVTLEIGYRCPDHEGPELFDVAFAPSAGRVAARFDLPIASSILLHHGGALELRTEGDSKLFVVRLPVAS